MICCVLHSALMRKVTQVQVSKPDPVQPRLTGPLPSREELTEVMRKRNELSKVGLDFLRWKLKVLIKLEQKDNRELILDLVNLLLACDFDHVIYCLWMLSDDPNRPHQDNWNHLLGIEYQDLDDIAKLFRRAATLLEKVAGGDLFRAFILPKWKQVGVKQTVQLLKSCAQLLSDSHSQPKQAILKKRPTTVAYRAALIAHVIKRTGKVHDRELSNLYYLAIGKCIDQKSWARWRKRPRNRQLIELYRS
jgi:hypothetical protein